MRDFLLKMRLPHWLCGVLALVLILRIPSFLEPYYYGDEMIYMTLGQGVRQGLTLYKDIHDNKPPLLYLTAAISENLFIFKAILAFWSLGTVILFYKLSQRLFEKNTKAQKLSTILFALLTTLPLLEGNTVNAELFMITFTIGAFLLLFKERVSMKATFIAGMLFGIGTLYKVPAAFDLPIIILYWLITTDFRKNIATIIKNTLVLATGFALPLAITFVWYFTQGALSEYIKAAFMQNVGYLSSFRPEDVKEPFLVRNGPLLIRAFLVLLGSGALFIFRKKLSSKFIFLTLWTLLGLFAVTLSERPYPHYLIQVAAPLAFLFTMLVFEKTVEQSLVIFPLLITLFVPVFYKYYHYSTINYYERFINFATGKIDKGTYFQSFSQTTRRNYEIAEFLVTSSNKSDRVFMWDPDSPVVYALSRRLPPIKYTADYHINDYSTKAITAQEIAKNPPKFIITTSGHPYEELKSLLGSRYFLIDQVQNANIYSRIDFASTQP
jgi:4-amino-4-deoxy-L-arabinose transferase-like glycosyltransferase